MSGPPRPAHPPSHWLVLALLGLCWGSAFVLVVFALQGLTPLQIVTGRIVTAAGVLAAVSWWLAGSLPREPRHWAYFLAMGLLGNCIPFLLIAWGQQHVASGEAGIVMAMVPLMVLVLGHFVLPGERLRAHRVGGFLLGFTGVVVLMGPGHLASLVHSEDQLARLALIAATLCYGTATVLAQLQPNRNLYQTSAGTLLTSSAVMCLLLGAAGELGALHATPVPALLAVLALGLLSTGVATLSYFWLAARAGAGFLSLSNYLVPLVAVAMGSVFAGERLPPNAWAALGLILAGVMLGQRRSGVAASPPAA